MSDAARACTSLSSQSVHLRVRRYRAQLTTQRVGTQPSGSSLVRSRDDTGENRSYACIFIFISLRLLRDHRALSAGALSVFHPGQMERQSVGSLDISNACFSYYVPQRRVLRYMILYVTDRRLVRTRRLIRHFGCQAYQNYFSLEFGLTSVFSFLPLHSLQTNHGLRRSFLDL